MSERDDQPSDGGLPIQIEVYFPAYPKLDYALLAHFIDACDPADDEKADHGKRDEDDAEEEAEQAPAASTSKAPKRLKIETHEADDTVDETDDAGEAK